MLEIRIKLRSFNLQKNVLLVYFWLENGQIGHLDDLKKRSLSPTPNVYKKPTVAKPVLDVHYDGIHYWPEFSETRNLCRVCSYLSFIYCSKCHMCLCLQKRRNCFYDSHK